MGWIRQVKFADRQAKSFVHPLSISNSNDGLYSIAYPSTTNTVLYLCGKSLNQVTMHSIMVLITLSDDGIETIKSNPELPKKEMEFVSHWKAENILESFFISVTKKDAVLIFQNVDEVQTQELIESLPYFPYMERIEYHSLNKQF